MDRAIDIAFMSNIDPGVQGNWWEQVKAAISCRSGMNVVAFRTAPTNWFAFLYSSRQSLVQSNFHNVVYLAQNEANYKDLLFNKMV